MLMVHLNENISLYGKHTFYVLVALKKIIIILRTVISHILWIQKKKKRNRSHQMKYPFKLTTHKYQITVFINLKKKKKNHLSAEN